MTEQRMRIPDLVMAEENLKAVNRLEKHGVLTKKVAEDARALLKTCALLYLSGLTAQVQAIREELNQGIAAIDRAAEKAKVESEKDFVRS